MGIDAKPVKSPPELIFVETYSRRSRFCIQGPGVEWLLCCLSADRFPTVTPGFLRRVLSVPENGVRTIENRLPSPEYLCQLRVLISQGVLPLLARPQRQVGKNDRPGRTRSFCSVSTLEKQFCHNFFISKLHHLFSIRILENSVEFDIKGAFLLTGLVALHL